jgi:acyl-CoA thioesterase-1
MKNRKQKSFAGIMAAAAIISLLYMACATTGGTTSAEAASAQETIVCLGDSLTAGTSITVAGKDDKSKAWPALLQNKVNIPVINAGVSGDTTAKALARVKRDVLSKNPRIVIIYLCANDLFQKVPMRTVEKNFQKIFDLLNDGNRKIYLVKFLTGISYDETVNMYNTLASSNNIEMIDGDTIDWDGYWSSDTLDTHPGAKGNEIFAEGIFKALKPYLEANNLLKE